MLIPPSANSFIYQISKKSSENCDTDQQGIKMRQKRQMENPRIFVRIEVQIVQIYSVASTLLEQALEALLSISLNFESIRLG